MPKAFVYMSIIETVTDVKNNFLSRREIVCNFVGLSGQLKKLDAIDMIVKEFDLANKFVIPIRLRTRVGQQNITGTFYVYDDEKLAKRHINPTVFARLEKAKTKLAEDTKSEDTSSENTQPENTTPEETK